MLSHTFHLRTNDVKAPLETQGKYIIIPKTDNTLHKIWLKLCNFLDNNLIKKCLKSCLNKIKRYSTNNENPLIMN
jgi:hypothetical protein